MKRDKECTRTITSHFTIRKPRFFKVILFFFAVSLYAPEIPAQVNTRYRIQIKALDRVKIDSVKLLCKSVAEQLDMAVYILDQDNYYKMAVGDFSTFGQANNKLDYISTLYNDAWIIPAYTEFVIFSVEPTPETDALPKKPLDTEIIDSDEVEPSVQDQSEISEPLIKEPIPAVLPIDDDEPVDEPSDQVELEPIAAPKQLVRKKLFWKVHGSGVYIDLHTSDPETRYCTYNGLGIGAGVFYTITRNLAFDLSAGYSMANAVAVFEKHAVLGNATVILVNPSLIAATDFYSKHGIYGKVGAGYFNYDYAYKLELKPGFTGGPASVETELLQRAATYGLDLGIGIRLFNHFDASFHTWFDQNSMRFYRVNFGIVF